MSIADIVVPMHHRRMKPRPEETPAQFVRRLRGEVGREKFAGPIGLTAKTIQRIEAGGAIGKEAALALARHSGVSAAWFMGEPESTARESRVELVKDEELSLDERALRSVDGLDDDLREDLRAYLRTTQLSTGATMIGPIITALEMKRNEILANRRGRVSEVQPNHKPPPDDGKMRRQPIKGGKGKKG